MRTGVMGRRLAGALFLLLGTTGLAGASPWGEVGDNQLRGDIEMLAAAGLIDGVTTQWPLPWTAIVPALKAADLDAQPDAVQAAALRVLGRAMRENRPGFSTSASLDLTNAPALVHGFDSLGRGRGKARWRCPTVPTPWPPGWPWAATPRTSRPAPPSWRWMTAIWR
ncbi:hypothetical protein [Nitrospirillum viridazoti]|uniref:hypothetical protein n=1 Tax=Nitrospirillum viridazoti TaxID=3144925 RepID=UPI001300BF68|nr:hypothetical protein [Nitrospirillum amazonense]